MTSKKIDIGSKDLISSLPDALVCHVLSFLSTKDAAVTSVLSKRWRYLLAFVPNLDFDSSIFKHPTRRRRTRQWIHKSFKVFVNRIMALQGNASLNKFSLKCKVRCDSACVNGWITNVLDRGVLDLDLYISSECDYKLPSKVFMSKTLVRLKVGGKGEFIIDVQEVFLPKLKTLYLLDVLEFKDQSGAGCAKLISGCLVLEELVMINLMWGLLGFCSVSNPTLKRVTICCEIIDENPQSVSFDTPNLVYLEFTDTVAVKYPKMILDSLVEARLGLRMTPLQVTNARDSVDGVEEMVGNAEDFFAGISNVQILYLSSDTLEVLTFCCKAIPLFNKLTHLTIETDKAVGWEPLPNLLENCPNLETLVFEGLHYKDTNQCEDERFSFNDTKKCWNNDRYMCLYKPWEGTPICLSSSPVKILKILKFGEVSVYSDDMDKQREVIKYLLGTMPNLEQVILDYGRIDGDVTEVSTQLQMLHQVASPKCKIQVISHNLTLASTVRLCSSKTGPTFFKNPFPV